MYCLCGTESTAKSALFRESFEGVDFVSFFPREAFPAEVPVGGGFAVAHPEIGEYIRLEGTREVVYVMIETKASEYQTTQNRGSFIDREGERS